MVVMAPMRPVTNDAPYNRPAGPDI